MRQARWGIFVGCHKSYCRYVLLATQFAMIGCIDPMETLVAMLQGRKRELPSVSVVVETLPVGAAGATYEASLGMTTLRIGSNTYQPHDVRIIAATHRNLKAKVADGSFREDLYYRLAVVETPVPALRERKDDIAPLVEHFLSAHGPPNTLALLEAHEWPGNVRELRNMVTRLLLFPI